MTKYEGYAVFLTVLQLLVSVLGFIVVAWTLRVLTRSIDAQSSAGVAARQLEFDKVILTYPGLYKYFYQSQDINPDDPELTRALAATQLLANYFDGYFQQQSMYRQMWPDKAWKSYIHDHVGKSPMLRRHVIENPKWFSRIRPDVSVSKSPQRIENSLSFTETPFFERRPDRSHELVENREVIRSVSGLDGSRRSD